VNQRSSVPELKNDWPAWHIWVTDAGTIMATRRRDLTDDELRAGLAMTLPLGVTGPPLTEQLLRQQHIEDTLSQKAETTR
jgi:hypothetical protein